LGTYTLEALECLKSWLKISKFLEDEEEDGVFIATALFFNPSPATDFSEIPLNDQVLFFYNLPSRRVSRGGRSLWS